MHFFDFIALVLAIRDIVDVWKNGSIFAERRAIVEAHDGRIEIQNHPAGGAVVTITLPASQG